MKKKTFFVAPLFALFLTGCFGTRLVGDTTTALPTSVDPAQGDSGEGYSKIKEFSFNLQDVKKTTEQMCLPSKGDSKLLVVPVKFIDGPEWTSYRLEVIRRAFFGEASETSWQSVSSFYKAASYGKLNISGEVAPVFNVDKTVYQAKNYKPDGDPAPDSFMLSYFEQSDDYNELRKRYDTNQDGYIDSVVFVYSNAIDVSEEETNYWAWVYWGEEDPSKERPVVNSYMWISYDFFADSVGFSGYGKSGIDAHTAAHETGHLLGLDDYYQYDEDQKFDPSGGLEMHSYNIGDENIYSKFALGWVNPYYVKTDSSVTLKLRSSALYDDAIILNDSWNQNSMDEYLMIEYYTPQGMNAQDAQKTYAPNMGTGCSRMYTTSGFRIYHIDSRLVELNGTTGLGKGYIDEMSSGYYSVGASNSPSRSYLNFLSKQKQIDYKYVHLLESNGKNTFKSGSSASNSTLFKGGSSFAASSQFFPNGNAFNNGEEIGYKIEIGECGDEYGTITISKC